jgi:hypothetical protein
MTTAIPSPSLPQKEERGVRRLSGLRGKFIECSMFLE